MNEQRSEVMNFMTKEEFIKESNIEIIQKIMERNNGYIIAKELEDFDISRNYLSIMTKKIKIDMIMNYTIDYIQTRENQTLALLNMQKMFNIYNLLIDNK